MSRRSLLMAAVCLAIFSGAAPARKTLRLDHVEVSYAGISEEYAKAIARTVAAARSIAAEQYGFDMPEAIVVAVTADPKGRTRMFNDGQDRIFLSIRSEEELQKPQSSGIFHLYGFCHEVGHLAMYRPIANRDWLTTPAAEGWAHWLGSQIVDEVYKREGPDLWPDRYDYRADGTARLRRQFASSASGDTVKGSRLWDALHEIAGDRGIMPIFAAWGKTDYDASDPAAGLGKAISGRSFPAEIAPWWEKAGDTFVEKRAKSEFARQTVSPTKLLGEAIELAHDDGRQAKVKSIAGGGHAMKFTTPDDESWYVAAVKIYGGQYGKRSSRDHFQVWICDDQFRPIADFEFSYAKIVYGSPRWNTLKLKPTLVPREFIVCFAFNPSATKGVFVGYDAQGSGHALSGLPGQKSSEFAAGDWMIRAEVDQLRGSEAKSPSPDAQMRQWTSANGKFQIQAEYLGLENGKVRLKKQDGKIIEVSLEKLSPSDQQYVHGAQKTQAEP